MNKRMFRTCAVASAVATLAWAGPTAEEDIDIYAGPVPVAARPNVLIVLDSSANWSANLPPDPECFYHDKEAGTKMGTEKCALYKLIDALPTDGHNVGLMLFNESPAANSGGYPRSAILALTEENKTRLKEEILSLRISQDKGNNAAFAKTLYEAFLYLTAAAPYRGTAGSE